MQGKGYGSALVLGAVSRKACQRTPQDTAPTLPLESFGWPLASLCPGVLVRTMEVVLLPQGATGSLGSRSTAGVE